MLGDREWLAALMDCWVEILSPMSPETSSNHPHYTLLLRCASGGVIGRSDLLLRGGIAAAGATTPSESCIWLIFSS